MAIKVFPVLSLMIAASLAAPAHGASLVTLSSPNDLAHLTVGSQAEIDVTLSGLPADDFIFNLETRVVFPSSELQLVSGPTPSKAFGSVFFGPDNIADPQLADFNANSGPIPGGGVIGNFLDETASGVGAIGQNGLYYSFVVQAIEPGSGTIAFDLTTPDANRFSGTETNFAFAPLPTGPALTFTIASVPEPTSGLLVLIGMSASGLWIVRKARPRQRA
jgi:hypothetical protein